MKLLFCWALQQLGSLFPPSDSLSANVLPHLWLWPGDVAHFHWNGVQRHTVLPSWLGRKSGCFFGAKEFTTLWYISKPYVWWRGDSFPTSLVKYRLSTTSLKSLWALDPSFSHNLSSLSRSCSQCSCWFETCWTREDHFCTFSSLSSP